jgi:hypothetical protein
MQLNRDKVDQYFQSSILPVFHTCALVIAL